MPPSKGRLVLGSILARDEVPLTARSAEKVGGVLAQPRCALWREVTCGQNQIAWSTVYEPLDAGLPPKKRLRELTHRERLHERLMP